MNQGIKLLELNWHCLIFEIWLYILVYFEQEKITWDVYTNDRYYGLVSRPYYNHEMFSFCATYFKDLRSSSDCLVIYRILI